jgi:hypothetical protein
VNEPQKPMSTQEIVGKVIEAQEKALGINSKTKK